MDVKWNHRHTLPGSVCQQFVFKLAVGSVCQCYDISLERNECDASTVSTATWITQSVADI